MASAARTLPIYPTVLGIILAVTFCQPASAQQSHSPVAVLDSTSLTPIWPLFPSSVSLHHAPYAQLFPRTFSSAQFTSTAKPFAKPVATNYLTTIDRWEAAFSCNDTPFVDQVRFPLASLWRGRLKLVGFESDVTTANFVLGLPGGGTLPSLGMFSSGHLATHTPPSLQLTGIHLTFDLRGSEIAPTDNSGLHGLQYVMRAGRGFFPSVAGH
ncbi:MAG TPA: hypothetical protein VGF61_03320 [Candidatus Acidoferrum sp.]|jgi:hypothetical protein